MSLVTSQYAKEKVLIWITCRDYERYLSESFSSAVVQTHYCSINIAHDHCGRSNPIGTAANRNRALVPSFDVDWLLFLDADDILPIDYVRALLLTGIEQQADIVTCDALKFGDEDGLIQVTQPVNYNTLLECNTVHCSALIRAKVFAQYGGYNKNLHSFEDWELWLRLARNGAKFVHCPDVRLMYRQHSDSRHHQKKENMHEMRERITR